MKHTEAHNYDEKYKYDEEHKYDDIIRLPHHVSKKHPQMSPLNRAAQFSPFAALTGHEDALHETARLTDSFAELDENRIEQLNEQFRLIRENLEQKPECEITYFQPDGKKSGGGYVTIRGRIKKIDPYERLIIFTDGTILPMDYLFSIKGELFQNMELSDMQP